MRIKIIAGLAGILLAASAGVLAQGRDIRQGVAQRIQELRAVSEANAVRDSRTSTGLDVMASDGARLKATYYSPGKPGPGMLLLHQCNMDRRSWEGLAAELVWHGIHVLTFDYRGYGESRTITGDYAKLPGDIDAALATLLAQPGVDKARLAAGGASCGVNNSVQLARRNGEIRALVLLSGATNKAGMDFLENSTLPVFFAYSVDEGGPLPEMKASLSRSKNTETKVHELNKAGHGVPMFTAAPTLLRATADWVARVLR